MEDPARFTVWLKRGTLEFCILGILAQQELYGMELIRRLNTLGALTSTEGALYPMLSRLRRTGWVSTSWRESPIGPARRYYKLTAEGYHVLAQFRREWLAFRDAVDQLVETESDE